MNERSEFTNTTTFFAENFLSVGGADDDFSTCVSDTDFAAGIALFGELAGEEFTEFGAEDTVGDEL